MNVGNIWGRGEGETMPRSRATLGPPPSLVWGATGRGDAEGSGRKDTAEPQSMNNTAQHVERGEGEREVVVYCKK